MVWITRSKVILQGFLLANSQDVEVYRYGPGDRYLGVADGTLNGFDYFGVQADRLPRVVVFDDSEHWVEDEQLGFCFLKSFFLKRTFGFKYFVFFSFLFFIISRIAFKMPFGLSRKRVFCFEGSFHFFVCFQHTGLLAGKKTFEVWKVFQSFWIPSFFRKFFRSTNRSQSQAVPPSRTSGRRPPAGRRHVAHEQHGQGPRAVGRAETGGRLFGPGPKSGEIHGICWEVPFFQ